MLKSVDTLRRLVAEPLLQRLGPDACVLTTEIHGPEVRGLAFCPGRILRYVLHHQSNQLRTSELLRLAGSRTIPAA
nr:hypothetical protein [Synechococcus sp. UW105]